ncbi:hypothetical protein VNO78_31888 [Psophocarpus tetragonolobus]|uniref:Uncharacterized protein n=1 Tax=Psophocarpus tetragonolobus TaxID=3891 RepID=A0AAN9X7Q4_PSOTE
MLPANCFGLIYLCELDLHLGFIAPYPHQSPIIYTLSLPRVITTINSQIASTVCMENWISLSPFAIQHPKPTLEAKSLQTPFSTGPVSFISCHVFLPLDKHNIK